MNRTKAGTSPCPLDVMRVDRVFVWLCRLCRHGEWTTYRLDDYFPCSPGGGPVYARAHGNELWCLLMQKVWTDACRVRVIVPLHHR